MPEQKPEKLTPQDVLLKAFEYFQTDRISLQSFITIGQATGSPNPEATQGVLNSLVNEGLLSWEKDENQTVWFTIPKPPEGEVH